MIGRCGFLVLGCLVITACATRKPKITGDLLEDIRNPDLAFTTRIALTEEVPAAIESGTISQTEAVEALKDIVWMRRLPAPMRAVALGQLVGEHGLLTNEEGLLLVMGLLPTETDPGIRLAASQHVVRHNWVEATSALVRSFSKIDRAVPDSARPEHLALLELHRDKDIEEIVFDTFVEHSPDEDRQLGSRIRRDAWNLLSRLDVDGEMRVNLLSGLLDQPPPENDPMLSALRRGLLELRTIPLTGEELEWLTDLHEGKGVGANGWWEGATDAVASLDAQQRRGIRLRHIEALRWAKANRPEWFAATRAELLTELDSRLAAREHRRRATDIMKFRSEDLSSNQEQMAWPDLITALVIDDAIQTARIRSALFDQAEEDREDKTTEYGGIIRISILRDEPDTYVAALYAPKPVMRESDTSFVASPEMLTESTTALAHYHFHAQTIRNGLYAGPSDGDMLYAARYGRACIVFTALDEVTLGVDLYQPDGVVLDLGEIKRPVGSS
ncbi:MAG: hypothetical protein KDA31_05140 [Phycisphaerales bacterium]|nr:hypothetical protein [Phycisphaerales bacterium]MCB9836381.1 hypothetical protein [Phycisphaera sp.]